VFWVNETEPGQELKTGGPEFTTMGGGGGGGLMTGGGGAAGG
jgi:hypothetical protein